MIMYMWQNLGCQLFGINLMIVFLCAPYNCWGQTEFIDDKIVFFDFFPFKCSLPCGMEGKWGILSFFENHCKRSFRGGNRGVEEGGLGCGRI